MSTPSFGVLDVVIDRIDKEIDFGKEFFSSFDFEKEKCKIKFLRLNRKVKVMIISQYFSSNFVSSYSRAFLVVS